VASIRTSDSAAPSGRSTGTITPVEVSLWAQAIASAAASARGSGASPGSASIRIGASRKGAVVVDLANLPENSP
jgi:hypothetical protein